LNESTGPTSCSRNGKAFEHPEGDLMATAEMIERRAAQTVSDDEFRTWVRERVRAPG
jgi:hypothetical protein